jgi:hypothetical protein
LKVVSITPARVQPIQVAGLAARVLVDGHQARHAPALLELAAYQMARALGRNHPHVDAGTGLDLSIVDREAVGEHQQVARRDPVPDPGLPRSPLLLVGKQDHDDIAFAGGVGNAVHGETVLGGDVDGPRPLAQSDDDVHARVVEIEGVGAAL